jgi:hypothetical protein
MNLHAYAHQKNKILLYARGQCLDAVSRNILTSTMVPQHVQTSIRIRTSKSKNLLYARGQCLDVVSRDTLTFMIIPWNNAAIFVGRYHNTSLEKGTHWFNVLACMFCLIAKWDDTAIMCVYTYACVYVYMHVCLSADTITPAWKRERIGSILVIFLYACFVYACVVCRYNDASLEMWAHWFNVFVCMFCLIAKCMCMISMKRCSHLCRQILRHQPGKVSTLVQFFHVFVCMFCVWNLLFAYTTTTPTAWKSERSGSMFLYACFCSLLRVCVCICQQIVRY